MNRKRLVLCILTTMLLGLSVSSVAAKLTEQPGQVDSRSGTQRLSDAIVESFPLNLSFLVLAEKVIRPSDGPR